jgi:hypothetical protein
LIYSDKKNQRFKNAESLRIDLLIGLHQWCNG